MSQVHKENLTAVDNALPNRAGLDIEIFGMEGIPEEIVTQHNQRVLTNYHQAEAERRAATGNSAPGSTLGNTTKKPKFESPSDLKKRLAEHKAKLAAEQNGEGSGGNTPVGAGQPPSSTQDSFVSPIAILVDQCSFIQQPGSQTTQSHQPYAPPPSSSVSFGQPPFPQQHPAVSYPSQNTSPFQNPPSLNGFTPQPSLSPFQQPPHNYPPQANFSPPPYQNQGPYSHQPNQYQPPYQPQASPPYQHQYQPQPYNPNHPNQGFPPQPMTNGPPSFQNPSGGPPRPFGAGSPMQQFQHQQPFPPRIHTPPQNTTLPQRNNSGSLPPAPGLPQRPAVGAPQVNAFQFQQMHQGQIPTPQNQPMHHQYPTQNGHPAGYQPQVVPQPQTIAPPPGLSQENPNATSLDDLISSASKQAESAASQTAKHAVEKEPELHPPAITESTKTTEPVSTLVPNAVKEDAVDDKASKKEKEKPKTTKLVYSDNEVSPEEKMAAMARYAFTPEKKTIMV